MKIDRPKIDVILTSSGTLSLGANDLRTTGTGYFGAIEVTSSTGIEHLNADMVDGKHASEFEPTLSKGNLTASAPLNQSGGTGAVIGSGVALTIDDATTGQKGAVQLSDSYVGTSSGVAVTELALSNGLGTKQDTLSTGNMTASSPIVVDQTRQVIGGAVVVSHSTSTGYKHLPTSGSSNQILKNSGSAGEGAWGTVTENAGALAAITTIEMNGQLTSTLPTGTAPLVVASSTGVTKLNADLLDGSHASDFVPTSRTITATAPIQIAGTTSANLSDDRTISIIAATTSVPGSMSSADKTKLDAIADSATRIPVVVAGGTVDAITADFTPNIALTDMTVCMIVASGANTVTNPTFNPDGLGAQTIYKKGGAALVAGDIPGALAVCILEYNLANTRWELLNPAVPCYQ